VYNRNLPILTGFKHRWADYSPFTHGRIGTEKLLERSETANPRFFAERYRKTRERVLNPDKIWT
jgi:hypothetical protein